MELTFAAWAAAVVKVSWKAVLAMKAGRHRGDGDPLRPDLLASALVKPTTPALAAP